MAGENKIVRLSPIRLGLNTTADDEARPADQCGDMANWMRDRSGAATTRHGFQRLADDSPGGNNYKGYGVASYSYFDSGTDSTKKEIILINGNNPKRLKKETLTLATTLGTDLQVDIRPFKTYTEYGLRITNSTNTILDTFNGSSYNLDLQDSHLHGSTVTVADDLPWSIFINIDAMTLPSAGNFISLVGNEGTSSKHERIDIDSSGDVFIYDNANNSQTWATGLSSGNLCFVCDGSNSNNIELFVNGVSQGTVTLADSKMSVRYIGQKGDSSQYFNGRLNTFYFFDDALSAANIASLVAGEHVTTDLVNFTPVNWYRLGDGITSAITVANLESYVDNHPDLSCTQTEGTTPAAFIPMQISTYLDTSVDINYYSLETIPTAYKVL